MPGDRQSGQRPPDPYWADGDLSMTRPGPEARPGGRWEEPRHAAPMGQPPDRPAWSGEGRDWSRTSQEAPPRRPVSRPADGGSWPDDGNWPIGHERGPDHGGSWPAGNERRPDGAHWPIGHERGPDHGESWPAGNERRPDGAHWPIGDERGPDHGERWPTGPQRWADSGDRWAEDPDGYGVALLDPQPQEHQPGPTRTRRAGRRGRRARRRSRRLARRTIAGRHPLLTGLAAVLVLLTPVWISLGNALTDPGLGTSAAARGAEWFREHGGSPIVNWAENLWYSHHQPPVGGHPASSAIPQLGSADPQSSARVAIAHLKPPRRMTSPAGHRLRAEGIWHPVARRVDGIPAVYETWVRPDAMHTSVVVGVAWMDTKLLRATLYSGSTIPGGGPYRHTAPDLDGRPPRAWWPPSTPDS